MGKFAICGTSVHEKVMETYPSSTGSLLTLDEYLKLSKSDQIPIDDLVEEQTVARLIVKNSLNDKLRDHLVTVFATGDDCYPNTISDALSLLSTFVKSKKDTTTDDAVVSYHETAEEGNTIDYDDTIPDDSNDVSDDNNGDINESVDKDEDLHNNRVTFSAMVMTAVINEATADADEEQFIGASFSQLQEVNDV
jgi:hypothetical protein